MSFRYDGPEEPPRAAVPAAAPSAGDYRQAVTFGLLYDVIGLLADAGVTWADDAPSRRADALVCLCALADAIAGPLTPQFPVPTSATPATPRPVTPREETRP